jgi:hypothetical protein
MPDTIPPDDTEGYRLLESLRASLDDLPRRIEESIDRGLQEGVQAPGGLRDSFSSLLASFRPTPPQSVAPATTSEFDASRGLSFTPTVILGQDVGVPVPPPVPTPAAQPDHQQPTVSGTTQALPVSPVSSAPGARAADEANRSGSLAAQVPALAGLARPNPYAGVAVAGVEATKSLFAFADATNAANKHLSTLSAPMTLPETLLSPSHLFRDFQLASEMSGTSVELRRAIDSLHQGLQPLIASAANSRNRAATGASRHLQAMAELWSHIANLLEPVLNQLANVIPVVTSVAKGILDAVLQLLELIGEMFPEVRTFIADFKLEQEMNAQNAALQNQTVANRANDLLNVVNAGRQFMTPRAVPAGGAP